jgi:opacity protein-like surface antigen
MTLQSDPAIGQFVNRLSSHSVATLLALAATLLPALAQIPMATEPLSRIGKAEFYGIGQYLHSEDITFNGPAGDVKTHMDDTGLGGFGVAFHFSDFFSLRGDFMFGGATFNANLPTAAGGTIPVKQDAFLQTGRLNLDYNIINRRITPFLTAGIGYQYIETELENAPPVGTCWWDPWYGWVCYYSEPHAWQTDFTWNAGAGFRWNITDNLFVKAMGGATWLEYGGAKGVTTQIEGIFCIGWSF